MVVAKRPSGKSTTAVRSESPATELPSSSPAGVATVSGSSRGVPRHVQQKIECEQKFTRITFAAIEPFPEGERDWDALEPAPHPLQNMDQWPRGRGRRERLNARSLEINNEGPPSPAPARKTPLVDAPPTATEGEATGASKPPEFAAEVAIVPLPPEGYHSVFRHLGRRRSSPWPRRLPDRFADLRGCPTHGAAFGGIRLVPLDGRDPPRGTCFNCRQGGHTRFNCREPPSLLCYNCGRRGTPLRGRPRCGEVHLEYLREQERAARHDVRSRSSGRPSEPRSDRRYPLTPPPTPPARHQQRDKRESPMCQALPLQLVEARSSSHHRHRKCRAEVPRRVPRQDHWRRGWA